MRTLLLGTDFIYNSDGELVPIEINTNTTLDFTTIENDDEIFDLTHLSNFIDSNNFKKVIYIGSMKKLSSMLFELISSKQNIEYEKHIISSGSITIPDIEDIENGGENLIIRSSYDVNAIVDETYCKNKINFLNLIKSENSFNSNFAYLDDNGILVNNITEIKNNGNHPNFILKSIYPQYNKNELPKLYKVENQSELDVIMNFIDSNTFLMEYHYNDMNLINGRLKVIRSFNLLLPPNLNNMPIGSHTKLANRYLDDLSTYDSGTFELNFIDRNKYLTDSDHSINSPKLIDTDKVIMADDTLKTALDLEVGDIIKTIDIPNPEDIDIESEFFDFEISYEDFVSGSTYTTNKILFKTRVDKLTKNIKIIFTDGTDWEDTASSNYLVVRNGMVMFKLIDDEQYEDYNLKIGDKIVLVDSTIPDKFSTVLKEVSNIVVSNDVFSGWEILVEKRHIFLTKTDDTEDNISYAAIEHNGTCTSYTPPACSRGTCDTKGYTCQDFDSLGCACKP